MNVKAAFLTVALVLAPVFIHAQVSDEVIWADLPNVGYMDFGYTIQTNSPIYGDWHVNAPGGRVSLNDRGLHFHVNGPEDVSGYVSWVQKRGEVRENPTRYPSTGSVQVFDVTFEVDSMPAALGHPITIFQRFRSDLDFPDMNVEMAGEGQFTNADPNSIVIHAWGDVWIRPNIMPQFRNNLVVIMENKDDGEYKVSFNGQTIATGNGTFAPPASYTGPQFGIYNHGQLPDYMQITHIKYRITEYTGKPDYDTINSIDPEASPPTNSAPYITSSPLESATADSAYRYDCEAEDSDGNNLTYSLIVKPDGMAIDSVTGVVTWLPADSDTGTHEVSIRVSDGLGGNDEQTFELTVDAAELAVRAGSDRQIESSSAFSLSILTSNSARQVTGIGYEVPGNEHGYQNVHLAVYNVLGHMVEELVNGPVQAGYHRVNLSPASSNRRDLAPGVYFCRMEAATYLRTIRITVAR